MIQNTNIPSNEPNNPPKPSNKDSKGLQVMGLVLVFAIAIIAIISRAQKRNLSTNTSGPEAASLTVLGASVPQACNVAKLEKSPMDGLKVFSPLGNNYVVNKEDSNGVAQIYLGNAGSTALTCITCTQKAGGPKPERLKMQPSWHPSGKWLFLAVERDEYTVPWIAPIPGWREAYIEGLLQSGIWVNMWAVSLNGETWHRMTDFKSGVVGTADGYTGVAFTPDGKKAVWSQVMDGNIFAYYPFGRWELTQADFIEEKGVPKLINRKNITPAGMNWNEPGNFSPDNVTLVLTGSTEKDAQGMDQYLLNIKTKKLTNLNNSPKIWDEHGVFSPDGKKILFMSSYPYRDDPNVHQVLGLKTEFMLMDRNGSNLQQLTHFRTAGFTEYSDGIAAVGAWSPDGKSLSLRQLVFPNYQDWQMTFSGACGKN